MYASDEKLTKSERIRRLFDAGMSVAEISAFLGVRYQFAYNVVSYYVKQKEVAATNDSNHGNHNSGRIYMGN